MKTFYLIHDRILFERSEQFVGTPAVCAEDIRNYMVHAAFYRIEGLPLPRALNRPGLGDTPWFASRKGVEKVSRRRRGMIDGALLDNLVTMVPAHCFADYGNIIREGRLKGRKGTTANYAIYAAELTSEKLAGGSGQDAPPGGHHPEDYFVAAVRLDGTIVGAAWFKRPSGCDLYRVATIAFKPPDGSASRDAARLHHRVQQVFKLEMMRYPALSIDFVGSVEPGLARVAYSMFINYRRSEMERLRGLDADRYRRLRRQTVRYRYPEFSRRQLVTGADMIRWILKRLPGRLRSLTACRRTKRLEPVHDRS